MPEQSEESSFKKGDIHRILQVARRRHLHFLVPFFLGWLLVWGASWLLAPRYKSATLILVQEPTMPQNFVAPNISDDMQARLESITQQILSRTRLLLIIDKEHLYQGPHGTPDEQIERMRKDIKVDLVRDPQRGNISAFRITYSAADPRVAQQVTGELTNLFINENNRVRQQESEGTTSFLEQQLEEARASLAAQEAKVRAFESQHQGALPTQQASNLQILGGLQSQLQSEQDALNTARQQRAYLQAMLEQERTAQGRSGGTSGTSVAGAASDQGSIDQQLDHLKAQLADLSSRYTDRYPDVLSLKSQIAKLEAARDRAAAAPSPRPGQTAPVATSNGPADVAIRQVQGQLQANQLEITNRENSIAELKGRINDYQGRLNSAPSTEQELADLTRGYDQSKVNYDDLLKKRDQSQMATSMEQMQQGERFIMLDPPVLPTKPAFPNHLIFCGAGLAVGIALGLMLAGGMEFLDDRLHTEEEIKDILPIAIMSEIPEIINPVDEENARKRSRVEWAATAAAILVIVAGALFSYIHG